MDTLVPPPPLHLPKGVVFSISNLAAFELCAKNYEEIYVEKSIPYSESAAQAGGKLTHKQLEDYVAHGKPLPIGLTAIRTYIDKICQGAINILTERRVALTHDLQPVGFFHDDVAYRGVIDLTVFRRDAVIICDYKTGNEPRDDFIQLRLNALSVFQEFPEVQKIHLVYLYTKFKPRRMTMLRHEIPALMAEIWPRVEKLRLAREKKLFPAQPGWKCKFCEVTKCQFNKKR
jgi:CRISPR/Cas system-associated exonuclease Cas4 (RecB family)